MRILMLSSVIEAVPPVKYGGVELVVYNLAEGLVKLGHKVTLFAPAGSKTSAKLIANAPGAGLRGKSKKMVHKAEFQMAADAVKMSKDFDIVHCHFGADVFPFAKIVEIFDAPVIFTFHGRLDLHQLKDFYSDPEIKKFNYVSISNDQRGSIPDLNYVATVYNGIDLKKIKYNPAPKDHLVFLGRISPEKGIVEAIKIAKRAKEKLHIFAKVDPFDQKYYETKVKPLIDGKQIVFHGERPKSEVLKYVGEAKAMLFPIQWREPFGLVMTESMACGTPVIASNRASTPEIIVDEKTGFLVDPQNLIEESLSALKRIHQINRLDCRRHVEKNFTAEKMVAGYVKAYEKVIKFDKRHK